MEIKEIEATNIRDLNWLGKMATSNGFSSLRLRISWPFGSLAWVFGGIAGKIDENFTAESLPNLLPV